MAMKITSDVLESYIHCKFKGFLKLTEQQGTKCDFEAMLTELRAEVRHKAIDTIIARYQADQVARNIPLATAGLKRGPQYILDGTHEEEVLTLHFDGLKRMEGESKLGDFHYLPVLFHEGQQVKKEQKLLLEVYGVILSGLQGRAPAFGVIWHGRECKATKVKLNPDHRRAEQVLRGLKDMASSSLPPRLLLNDHCPVCEFRQRCHDQAVQEDNITLLRGMGEKEVNRYARKGISTVTQLSCTFRMRKRGKRVKTQQRPHYFALRALALREKKIYVLGTPTLPITPVHLYFDCEGDPVRGYVYLIGLTVVGDGEERHYSFWADNEGGGKVNLSAVSRRSGPVSRFNSLLLRQLRTGVPPEDAEGCGGEEVGRPCADRFLQCHLSHLRHHLLSDLLKRAEARRRVPGLHLVRGQRLRGSECGVAKGVGVWRREFRQAETHHLQRRGLRRPQAGD
jgi:predicted RecB family nuclease